MKNWIPHGLARKKIYINFPLVGIHADEHVRWVGRTCAGGFVFIVPANYSSLRPRYAFSHIIYCRCCCCCCCCCCGTGALGLCRNNWCTPREIDAPLFSFSHREQPVGALPSALLSRTITSDNKHALARPLIFDFSLCGSIVRGPVLFTNISPRPWCAFPAIIDTNRAPVRVCRGVLCVIRGYLRAWRFLPVKESRDAHKVPAEKGSRNFAGCCRECVGRWPIWIG